MHVLTLLICAEFAGKFYSKEVLLTKETYQGSCIYLVTSKSNHKNFCSQKCAFFWAYFLSNYVNLNLVKFQLQRINQQEDSENGILLPVSTGIFSSENAPNFKPLFLRFDTSLNYGTKKIWNTSSFLNLEKYYTINKF